MTPRERLQLAYELAFCPWRLNGKWRGWLADPASADPDELKALDDAARLHLPLPQRPVSSMRALYRLARFQAESCEYRMRTFIGNVRRALNRMELSETEVPVGMVRDVALPQFRRSAILKEKTTERGKTMSNEPNKPIGAQDLTEKELEGVVGGRVRTSELQEPPGEELRPREF